MYVCKDCMSVVYNGPNWRTERLRKTDIGTEVAHVTRESDTIFKIKRSRSPGRFTQRGLNAWGRCSGDRDNVLDVGNYCYVASVQWRARRLGAHGGGGAGAYRVATRTARLVRKSYSVHMKNKKKPQEMRTKLDTHTDCQ